MTEITGPKESSTESSARPAWPDPPAAKRRSFGKWVLLGLAGAALLALLVRLALPSFESVLRDRVEQTGAALTGVPVRVAAVEVAWPLGAGRLHGLWLGNPPGFGDGPALEAATIDFRVEPATLESSPVVVERVTVAGPRVFVVVNAEGRSNFHVIDERVRAAEHSRAEPDLLRLAIARLEIEAGTVLISAPAFLGKDLQGPLQVPLEGVVLTDLGTDGPGLTVHQIGERVHDALVHQVASAVARTALARLVDEGTETARKARDLLLSPSVRRPIEAWTDALGAGAGALERKLRRATGD